MGFADVLGLFASARQICAARIDLVSPVVRRRQCGVGERPHGRPGASWCVSPARSPFFQWFGGLWFGDDGLCFPLSCLRDNLGPIRYRPSGFLLQVGSRGVWTFVAWPALWSAPDPSRMPGRTVAGVGSPVTQVFHEKTRWAPKRPTGHQVKTRWAPKRPTGHRF